LLNLTQNVQNQTYKKANLLPEILPKFPPRKFAGTKAISQMIQSKITQKTVLKLYQTWKSQQQHAK